MTFNERQTRIIRDLQEKASAAYFVSHSLRARDLKSAEVWQRMAADYSWAVRRIMGLDE